MKNKQSAPLRAFIHWVFTFAHPIAFMTLLAVMLTVVGSPFLQGWRNLPSEMPDVAVGHKNVLLAADGRPFAETWVEDRTELKSLSDISQYAIDALIATEDNRFYHNNGFDIQGTVRAAITGSGGGSGITQQLVKNLQYYDLDGDKSYATEATISRKLRELKLAMNYEREHTKDEILLNYFNLVAFGDPSVYSIENASQRLFGKPARELGVGEAAALIGSVQNPSVYNLSSKDPDTVAMVKQRQRDVLGRMLSEGYITQQEHDTAVNEPINTIEAPPTNSTCSSSEYVFYCKYTLDTIRNNPRYGATPEEREALIARGGLKIQTYLDRDIIKTIDEQLEKDYGNDNRVAVPTAVVKNDNGAVVGFGTNREYGSGEGSTEIDLARFPTGSGSVFKLMTLAAAVNNGYDRSDLAFSSQCPLYPGSSYDAPPGGFKNSNSCSLQGGFLDYKKATAYSSNTWYVTLEMMVGVDKVKEFAASVGLPAGDSIGERSLSYTLGATEHSAIDMAGAYASFANEGVYCPPTPIKEVTYDGRPIRLPDGYDDTADKCRAVTSPKGASIVLEAMRANVSGEVPGAFGTQYKLTTGQDSVGKSGTNELQNSTWVQSTGNYTVYSNMFDPEVASRGIATVYYRGGAANWGDHVVGYTGRDILSSVVKEKGYKPLNYSATSEDFKPTVINQKDLFTVPYLVGMRQGDALAVAEKLGLKAVIKKAPATDSPAFYPDGVVAQQSIEAGSRLSFGTDKTLELTVTGD